MLPSRLLVRGASTLSKAPRAVASKARKEAKAGAATPTEDANWAASTYTREAKGDSFMLSKDARGEDSLPSRDAQPKKKHSNCVVYGFGLSASGALSIPSLVVQDKMVTSKRVSSYFSVYSGELLKPLQIAFCNIREIKKVSSGFGFSLFASKNKLYGSGLNNRSQIAGRVLGGGEKGGKEEYYISGRRVGGFPEGKILDIASGRAHSLVIVDDKVYAFGCNVHGQCGQDPTTTSETIFVSGEDAFLPAIPLPTSSRPVKVHAALDTSFVLTEDGKLYSFGLNEDGQCANGKMGIQTEPREVEGDSRGERLLNISGSTDTLMAVGESGRVFVWGQNEYGQAGEENSDEIQLTSSRVLSSPVLRDKKVVDAAATATTCVLATQDGACFSWGVGVLGFGPDTVRLRQPHVLPPVLFDGLKVNRVHAGNVSCAAINEEGNMYVWGQNRYGILGLGHTRDQLFPFPLFFQEDVKELSMGPDHTLVVVK
ncbi:hypothetical protein PMAYCL1PPCAC_25182 [Pristionchus mayeri]|uniref:Uncharacterized protein n=1 Tax=Pristionchus mayeri TaxID=1317129 RepID=A0AAN5I740_9BILA|nr:hypothetical protein PMAYCL1PPCAC_25182 [Pristionchus mayeri]